MKVAIVHEWLETYGGSERVLEQIVNSFPDADVFAVVDFMAPGERRFLAGRPVKTSFIQSLPFVRRHFRAYLPLMPVAIEQFDLSAYDLVLSSSHAVAKGVLTSPHQIHVSYVHSPMRYAWDQQAQYLRQSGLDRGLKSAYVRWVLHGLRTWDVRSANGVDKFLANSSFIAARINKIYRRKATVLHPPVNLDAFRPGEGRGDTYVVASRLVPYKRVDLIVKAFAMMPERRLLVIGSGPEAGRIREASRGSANIEFAAPMPQDMLVRTLQQARAFVFGAEEDFGITLVEAQACGTPVIAFGRGGAVDIVQDQLTGILFDEQTPVAVVDAVRRFEAVETTITPELCRKNALRFSVANFNAGLRDAVDAAINAKRQEVPVGNRRLQMA